MAAPVVYNELLGHLVRSEEWLQHGRSSYRLAEDAARRGDFDAAEAYGRLTVQEAQEAYDLFEAWLVQIPSTLVDSGARVAEIADEIGDPDLTTGWAAYRAHVEEFASHCANADPDGAVAALERARSTWQHHHDLACDTICALFGVAAESHGESFVGTLWDMLLDSMYRRSAQVYDPAGLPWAQSTQRLLLDIFEATRGHLAGPDRDGAFDVREDPEKWTITFAPCGSGGRQLVGEADASPRRAVTTQPHDWAWNTTGVCLYCAHCCQLQQRAPIERLGFPLRVIEPPVAGQAKSVCTWSIYKDRADIPDEAYTRVGFTPPRRAPRPL